MRERLLLILGLALIAGGSCSAASSSSLVESTKTTTRCMTDILRASADVEDIRSATISYDRGGTFPLVTFMLKDATGYVRPIYVEIYDRNGPNYLYDLGGVMAMANDDRRIGDIAYEWELK